MINTNGINNLFYSVQNHFDYISGNENRKVPFAKIEQSHKKWLCSEGTATNWIAAKTSAENVANNGDGRVIKNGTVFQYEYNIKDHLGNVRATFCDVNNNGIISNSVVERRSRNDYYSFGMEHFKGTNEYTAQKNNYKYNSKELVEEMGWNNLLYGARIYDAAIGRFGTIDRFSDKYISMSPYQYGDNNPIKFIDVNGDSIDLSQLTGESLKIYNETIDLLSQNDQFKYFYTQLQNSTSIYKILPNNSKHPTNSVVGGYFYPKTGEIAAGENFSPYILAQELFHAYQYDMAFYTKDDYSVLETEGDILSMYVTFDVGLPIPSNEWATFFENELYDKGFIKFEDIISENYIQEFNKSVDQRIKYYKSTDLVAPTYTSPNSGKGPIALTYILKNCCKK
jgi:RHS repeat-associated protein